MAEKLSLKQGRHQGPDVGATSGGDGTAGATKKWNYTIGIRIFQDNPARPPALEALMVNGFPADEPIPGELCQAARTMLGLSQRQLAEAAGVSKLYINDFENGFRRIAAKSVAKLRAALEAGGARFLKGDGCTGVVTEMDRPEFERQSRSPERRERGAGSDADGAEAEGGGQQAPRPRGRPRKASLPPAA
ncbi:helix-turn-helix domain-containing protein [Microvirga arsenatis]|nr:helix-turn-helix transcriptional regulator [Microvirga arsenatis]